MRPIFITFTIILCFTELLWSQEIVSEVIIQSKTKTPVKTEFRKSDLITPVLLQSSLEQSSSTGFTSSLSSRAGYAFLGSAILPGLSQAVNKNWIRSGLFLAIEAASIYLAVDYQNRAKAGERNYENWADQNWSVVQYAGWLVEYHEVHNINNPFIDELSEMVTGAEPAFNTSTDWSRVDLDVLRDVERNSPFIVTDDQTANNFSHTLPDYGSQQYYELIAKYFQFQAGWKDYDDFHDNLGHTEDQYIQRYFIDRNGAYASSMFWDGVDRAQQFNDYYRTGNNFKLLLIVNHVFSAFDAYFSIRLKQNRLEATPSVMPGRQLNLSYRF